MTDVGKIIRDVEEAHALRHPQRAMRVLLECGHLRLIPFIHTVMGVGAHTSCGLCPWDVNGHHVARLVVGVEETGVLWTEDMGREPARAPEGQQG